MPNLLLWCKGRKKNEHRKRLKFSQLLGVQHVYTQGVGVQFLFKNKRRVVAKSFGVHFIYSNADKLKYTEKMLYDRNDSIEFQHIDWKGCVLHTFSQGKKMFPLRVKCNSKMAAEQQLLISAFSLYLSVMLVTKFKSYKF